MPVSNLGAQYVKDTRELTDAIETYITIVSGNQLRLAGVGGWPHHVCSMQLAMHLGMLAYARVLIFQQQLHPSYAWRPRHFSVGGASDLQTSWQDFPAAATLAVRGTH